MPIELPLRVIALMVRVSHPVVDEYSGKAERSAVYGLWESPFNAIEMAYLLSITTIWCYFNGMLCSIDVFVEGRWQTAASFEAWAGREGVGYRGGGLFEYDLTFAANYLGRADAAVSVRFPVDFAHHSMEHWPAFLLDLLPAGAARRDILNRLQLSDGPAADWPLLLQGAGNPVGHLRITEAVIEPPPMAHPGFARAEVVQRGDSFIEYAHEQGASVSGSSGAQGDAPKFLLVEDNHGRWHADCALPDARVARHWLVKFPRGKAESDKRVLRNEQPYYAVAKAVGLTVGEPLLYESNTLFIPRFDREVTGGVVLRHGLESLCSAAGIAEFGAHPTLDELLAIIHRYSDAPQEDIIEFLLRDILNVAMGNTDNHPRNSALLKRNGAVRLSPLYDFAPMILDDQGIARSCRWAKQDAGGRPEWAAIVAELALDGVDNQEVARRVARFARHIDHLDVTLLAHGVDQELVTQLKGRIETVQSRLAAFR